MKTQSHQKVIEISKKITPRYSQIVIDLFQDDLEDLLEDESRTPDDIGSFSYNVSILLEVFNPILKLDIELLKELESALDNWSSDAEFVNRSLGLDPNV